MDLSERSHDGEATRHPWETARCGFFGRVLREAGALDASRSFLDVGAGDGFFAGELLARAPAGSSIVCYDIGYEPAVVADLERRHPSLRFVRSCPSEPFDVVTLLDVVEHVEDDLAFLGGIVDDALAPGGLALVSVPAWPTLFSDHDVALRHFRRYTPDGLRELIGRVGLDIEGQGGLFLSLTPVRAAEVAVQKGRGLLASLRGQERAPPPEPELSWRGGPWLTRAVDSALAVDNAATALAAKLGVPAPGLSTWALCRKPSQPGQRRQPSQPRRAGVQ